MKRGSAWRGSVLLLAGLLLAAAPGIALAAQIDVSQPTLVTSDAYYERGPSVLEDAGGTVWLFYGRSEDCTGHYGNSNPDNSHYVVYYKTAADAAGLAAASPQAVPDMPAGTEKIYQGQTACAEYDGKIWLFATDSSGGTDIVYWTWDSGSGWSSRTDTGFDGFHIDVAAHGGLLWLSWNDNVAANVAAFDGSVWSAAEAIQGTPTISPITRLYVDAGGDLILYFPNGWGVTPDIYYFYVYSAGWPTAATATLEITEDAGIHDCDPVLTEVAGEYLFVWAPWDDVATKQWLDARRAPTLAGLQSAATTRITFGGYGAIPWVDMWPCALGGGGGGGCLVYGTEADGTARGTGNIAVLPLDWDTTHDHYCYVQNAVDAAQEIDDVVHVAAGTYEEQVVIDHDLELLGAGAATTTILSPETLTAGFGTTTNYPIVYVNGASDVQINGFTIDGAGRGNANYRFLGIAYHNAGGAVENCEVLRVRDTPFSGAQHGVGVYCTNDDGGSYSLALRNILLQDFQKNGTALLGEDTSLILENVTAIGAGATGVTAQNGIQISDGAGGTVTDCAVSDIAYTGGDWAATGFLTYLAGDLDVAGLTAARCGVSWWGDATRADFTGGSITEPLGDGIYLDSTAGLKGRGERSAPSPFDGDRPRPAGRTLQTYTFDGVVIQGAGAAGSVGVWPWAQDDLDLTMTGCTIAGWDVGLYLEEDGGVLGGQASDNTIAGNTTYGIESTTAADYDARGNWWGHHAGPYHPSSNPLGQGDAVSDHVLFDPWRGMADLAPLPATSGPINCSQYQTLAFHYTPDADTPALRGYELTVESTHHLDFGAGDVHDSGVLAGLGDHLFQVVDNGDGTFTVADAILGATSGLTTEADLFSIDFHGLATGDGEVEIIHYKLRTLDNEDIFATLAGATVTVDCTPPDTPTMAAEPAYTRGTENEVTWTNESASGAVQYLAQRARDAAFTVDVQDSGWIPAMHHQFAGLMDGQQYWYRAKARDALDNESAWSNVETSTQDASPPVTSADPLAAYQSALTFDVAYTAADATSGVAHVALWYRVDAGAWTHYGDFTASPVSFTASVEGAHDFYTIGTDNVGNDEYPPGAYDATTIVDVTPPAGGFAIDGGAAYTNDLNVTLNSSVTDDNPPLQMHFRNAGDPWPGSWVAYTASYSWTLASGADGLRTVEGQYRDAAGNILNASDDIYYDTTPPGAVTDLAAAPGHEKVVVTWNDPGDGDLTKLEVWRAYWHDGSLVSVYPEYDDDAGSTIPTRPADRAAALASPEWEAAGLADPDDETYTDENPPRGVYWYEVFAVDGAYNFGPRAAANDRATNYWLGDVCSDLPFDLAYNGLVNTPDVTQLATAFGQAEGGPDYDNECDVGPTDTMGRLGIPTTDNVVDFEDLMVFAMNYGVVAPRPLPAEGTAVAQLTWYRVDETTWALGLLAPCLDLKGLRLTASLPAGVTATAAAGAMIQQQGAPCFLRALPGEGLDLSLALMGRSAAIRGDGELVRVSLSAPVEPGEPELAVRGGANESVEFTLEATEIVALPAAYRLAGNYPNPFNPKTTIRFDLPETQSVRLAIFDAAGRRVATLVDATLPAGYHDATWNGRDDAGRALASGVYFYRLEAGPLRETRRMLLLK